jgi:hypothetical protein
MKYNIGNFKAISAAAPLAKKSFLSGVQTTLWG